jgi:hypothetical protein
MIGTIALSIALLGAPQNDRPAVEAACAKIAKATQTRDWKALKALSTPDFVQHTKQGQNIHIDDLTKGFDQLLKTVSNPKVTYKILTFKSDGSKATAEVYWSIFADTKDKKGKAHRLELSDSEQDIFRKVKGNWLEASVTEHSSVQKVDGKPITAMGQQA